MILMIEHAVRDYDEWRKVFDEHRSVQRKYGMRGYLIYRDAEEPNVIVVLAQFPDREAAMGFLHDPSLQEEMQRAGVEGRPAMRVYEEVDAVDMRRIQAA